MKTWRTLELIIIIELWNRSVKDSCLISPCLPQSEGWWVWVSSGLHSTKPRLKTSDFCLTVSEKTMVSSESQTNMNWKHRCLSHVLAVVFEQIHTQILKWNAESPVFPNSSEWFVRKEVLSRSHRGKNRNKSLIYQLNESSPGPSRTASLVALCVDSTGLKCAFIKTGRRHRVWKKKLFVWIYCHKQNKFSENVCCCGSKLDKRLCSETDSCSIFH